MNPILPGFSLTGEMVRWNVRGAEVPEAPRRELVSVGDETVEAIVGYRCWRVSSEEGRTSLLSTWAHVPWPRGGEPLESKHVMSCVSLLTGGRGRGFVVKEVDVDGRVSVEVKHEAPRLRCTCGVYACNDPLLVDSFRPGLVLGEVHLWGRVAMHEKGYRAQFARPASLYLPSEEESRVLERCGHYPDPELIKLVALQHGIPLVQLPPGFVTLPAPEQELLVTMSRNLDALMFERIMYGEDGYRDRFSSVLKTST